MPIVIADADTFDIITAVIVRSFARYLSNNFPESLTGSEFRGRTFFHYRKSDRADIRVLCNGGVPLLRQFRKFAVPFKQTSRCLISLDSQILRRAHHLLFIVILSRITMLIDLNAAYISIFIIKFRWLVDLIRIVTYKCTRIYNVCENIHNSVVSCICCISILVEYIRVRNKISKLESHHWKVNASISQSSRTLMCTYTSKLQCK